MRTPKLSKNTGHTMNFDYCLGCEGLRDEVLPSNEGLRRKSDGGKKNHQIFVCLKFKFIVKTSNMFFCFKIQLALTEYIVSTDGLKGEEIIQFDEICSVSPGPITPSWWYFILNEWPRGCRLCSLWVLHKAT